MQVITRLKSRPLSSADFVASTSLTAVDFGASASKSPMADDFIKCFDFSSFDPMDDDKPDTLGLVQASSTNPSPEINAAEPDGHALSNPVPSSSTIAYHVYPRADQRGHRPTPSNSSRAASRYLKNSSRYSTPPMAP
jgi:hypothetical protein